ncbi:hypothetical protein BLNAU_3180 [Blattamonas nauphoetae]|uniref:Uncharacterized protein n=1 Tax=Blattamonas nauphoetae TaxID=2049346 RepID=A0ABQ9YDA5_9EUKA|nr:hypothetical protein BLNAU_3180 [Blattamonas nauphoetae]
MNRIKIEYPIEVNCPVQRWHRPIQLTCQPHPPKVTGATFNFTNSLNTTYTVTLTGSYLDLQGNYLVTLQSGPTLTIMFNESEQAVSPILLIGRPGTLKFNTVYSVISIKREDDEADVVHVDGLVTFETGSKPTPLTLIVDEKTGSMTPDCGDSVIPCSSVDVAWDVASVLSISQIKLRVVQSVSQSKPWSVTTNGFLVISEDQAGIPTLRIPSSASMGEEEGMIVVDGGILDIRNITVLIENGSESFVFAFCRHSTVFLVASSITGVEINTTSDESEDVCSWSSGILRLVNCETLLEYAKLTHHSQGAINMEGGSLTSERNIFCTGSSDIKIESLSGGDGSKDYPSPWISLNDCNLTGEHAQPDTPMFIPTLSTDSKSTLNKKNKAFSIDVKGSTLIPARRSLNPRSLSKQSGMARTTGIREQRHNKHFIRGSEELS